MRPSYQARWVRSARDSPSPDSTLSYHPTLLSSQTTHSHRPCFHSHRPCLHSSFFHSCVADSSGCLHSLADGQLGVIAFFIFQGRQTFLPYQSAYLLGKSRPVFFSRSFSDIVNCLHYKAQLNADAQFPSLSTCLMF